MVAEVEAAAARTVEAAESARQAAGWRDEWQRTTDTSRQLLELRFAVERESGQAAARRAARRAQYRADFPPLSQIERRRTWMSRALSRARTYLSGT
jgi:hypothetical protein